MRFILPLSLCLLVAAVPAQGNRTDVGLTSDAGPLPVVLGQACGPFSCTPLSGGSVAPGQSRNLTAWAAPRGAYALAAGLPTRVCPVFPPIFRGAPSLGPPVITLAVGVVGSVDPRSPCGQGTATTTLRYPRTLPVGLVLHLQVVGQSQLPRTPIGFSNALAVQITR